MLRHKVTHVRDGHTQLPVALCLRVHVVGVVGGQQIPVDRAGRFIEHRPRRPDPVCGAVVDFGFWLVLLGYAVVLLLIGYALSWRRDVS